MKMIITAFINKGTRDVYKLYGGLYVSVTIPEVHHVMNLKAAMDDPELLIKSVKFINNERIQIDRNRTNVHRPKA